MSRFNEAVILPKGGCPWGGDDCNSCEFLKYIGTFGGEYYIDCDYDKDSI